MPLLPSQRADFSAIVDRPIRRLPNDARIVVWTIVNLEVWDISRPMPRQVLPPPAVRTGRRPSDPPAAAVARRQVRVRGGAGDRQLGASTGEYSEGVNNGGF